MRSCSSPLMLRLAQYAALSLLILAMFVSPASAQTAEPPVVRAVLFTSPICSFCRQIVERDLSPAIQKFGQQLQIIHVDVNTPEGERLYEAALTASELPRGVPLLFVGQDTLGGVNIMPQLPDLVDTYLAQGGVDFPAIPGLDKYMAPAQETEPSISSSEPITNQAAQTSDMPLVRAMMFWMDGCPHCHEVLDHVLPPLQEKYGAQLNILLVEVATMQDIDMLYQVAAAYNIPKEQTFVPFLIIGETTLVGADNIQAHLPSLIEQHLAQGGVEVPDIYHSYISLSTASPVQEKTTVYIFWGDGCPHCEAARPFLHELAQQYPNAEIIEYEVWYQIENQALVVQMAAKFGFEPRFVPTIFIGDRYWEGFSDEMKSELENAMASCAEAGCPDAGLGIIPDPTELPVSQPEVSTSTEVQSNGFTLAIVIMVGMGVTLLYSLITFVRGKVFSLPAWGDGLTPVLIVIGIGVAAYLAYVETQSVEAVCGPVGDCNTVQQSRYATLFGFLPVGVLGLFGYLGMLAAWLTRKYLPNLAKLADLTFFALAVFAAIFSLYLTYLEPFIIRAVCIWCLTSAVIVTLLLLLGTPPAILQLSMADKDD